ncbi:hypothetical protein COO60DRAFT_857116 [Scenedesmus sp. NREL 46B-D3]|nr:hypothetical protein COO60DRAFT_857116 [Scenedesmus sp. NREL 46B-D3]
MHKVHEVARADSCPQAAAAAAGAGSSLLAAGGGPGSALLAVAGGGSGTDGSGGGGSAAARLVRMRGTFMQTNTSTGRLSMDDPSLQTIPRPVEYQLALSPGSQASAAAAAAADGDDSGSSGADAASPAAVMQQQLSNIRAAFVAPAGSVLVSADYCQIELRLMAHFSADASLLGALARPGADPFVELAASWLRLDKAQVTPEQRGHAKRLAYGLLYGMGPSALAADLGVSMGQAVQLADDFRRSHPGLDAWIKGIIGGCRDTTWVTTIAGRRRHLPNIRASGKNSSAERSQAERQAVNSVCQGSAADVVKGPCCSWRSSWSSEAGQATPGCCCSWGQLQEYDGDGATGTPVTAPRG